MYEKMYTVLFNAVTETLRFLDEEDNAAARWRLEEGRSEEHTSSSHGASSRKPSSA